VVTQGLQRIHKVVFTYIPHLGHEPSRTGHTTVERTNTPDVPPSSEMARHKSARTP
jgi:hypothetical protein